VTQVSTYRALAWERHFSQRAGSVASSAIRDILKVIRQPGYISLAGGMPPPELFPLDAYRDAAERVLTQRGREALQYGLTEGYPPLREFVVEWMGPMGVALRVDNVLITSGGMQGIDLCGRLLLDAGDSVLMEAPTFLGALQVFAVNQATCLSVRVDDGGLDIEALEKKLAQRPFDGAHGKPAFMYLIPTFQNPSGMTLSLERREEVIALAAQYQVPIVEDDPYSHLRFEGDSLPSLMALDAEHHSTGHGKLRGNVIYIGSFSKILGPGLRVGWLAAPAEVIRRLALLKQGTDLHTGVLAQMIVHEIVRDGEFLLRHVERLRAVLRERRDVMVAAIERYFPPGLHWVNPQGGLFIWVTLPPSLDAVELLEEALEHKVAFVPGFSFFPDGGGHNTLRLNFSYPSPAEIEVGIQRLGRILARHLE
jgi:2-aminoadipate transaminase